MERTWAKAFPVTISTVIVSPMARPMPSITAARTPDLAAGSCTRHTVCHGVAPMARLALLYSFGTEARASSAMLTMVGNAMNASMMAPVRATVPLDRFSIFCSSGARVTRPMNPTTTEGSPRPSRCPVSVSRTRFRAISPM